MLELLKIVFTFSRSYSSCHVPYCNSPSKNKMDLGDRSTVNSSILGATNICPLPAPSKKSKTTEKEKELSRQSERLCVDRTDCSNT
jgi:hypothetical protein